jgi:hypothetical protein
VALLRHLLFLSFGAGLLVGAWSAGAPGAAPATAVFFGSYALVSLAYAAAGAVRGRDARA